jgi:hypothetical protein
LATKQNRKAIRTALERLPKELDETYKEAMQRVNSQNEDDASLACRILSWISFAERALTVPELKHAVAVEDIEREENALDEDGVIDEDILITVCCGIVTIDKKSDIIRLIHYSAQEYFDRLRDAIFPAARLALTTAYQVPNS